MPLFHIYSVCVCDRYWHRSIFSNVTILHAICACRVIKIYSNRGSSTQHKTQHTHWEQQQQQQRFIHQASRRLCASFNCAAASADHQCLRVTASVPCSMCGDVVCNRCQYVIVLIQYYMYVWGRIHKWMHTCVNRAYVPWHFRSRTGEPSHTFHQNETMICSIRTNVNVCLCVCACSVWVCRQQTVPLLHTNVRLPTINKQNGCGSLSSKLTAQHSAATVSRKRGNMKEEEEWIRRRKKNTALLNNFRIGISQFARKGRRVNTVLFLRTRILFFGSE